MSEEFDELDLLAYADGRLTGDRAARVEAYLRQRPELAAKVADFTRQDRELHAQFDRYADEPLPERLAGLFAEKPAQGRRWNGRVLAQQAAAAALLIAVTGGGGWWLGQSTNGDVDARAFVNSAIEKYVSAGSPSQAEVAGAQRMAAGEPTLQRFSDRISLELQAPDLSAHGYRLVDKNRVTLDGGQPGLVLRYAGAEGDEVQVFLKSRWRDRAKDVRTERQGDIAVTYWNDGPLAVAVASSRGDGPAVRELAAEVQRAFGRSGEPEGEQPPTGEIPTLEPYAAPQGATQEASTPAAGAGGSGGVQ